MILWWCMLIWALHISAFKIKNNVPCIAIKARSIMFLRSQLWIHLVHKNTFLPTSFLGDDAQYFEKSWMFGENSMLTLMSDIGWARLSYFPHALILTSKMRPELSQCDLFLEWNKVSLEQMQHQGTEYFANISWPLLKKYYCNSSAVHVNVVILEAATQKYSWEKVLWNYTANLQENTHAEVRFQ